MCLPKRYFVTFFVFLGLINHYYLRINLSMAIVDMTSDKITIVGNETKFQEAEFQWNSKEIGFILSAFFYGNMMAPIGGYLAPIFGGATIFGLGIAITALLTLLSPVLVRLSFTLFFIVRILEGIAEGCALTGEIELWSRWAPIKERSRILSYSFAGTFMGTIMTFQLSGVFVKLWKWPSVFYIPGIIALIWYCLFAMFVSNDPATDKFIPEKERLYIAKNTNRGSSCDKQNVYPWKKMLSSGAVWATFMFYFLAFSEQMITTTYLPIYIKDVSDINIEQIGLVSSVPHVIALLSQSPMGWLADYLRNKNILTATQVCKLYICCGGIMITVVLSIIGYQTDLILITGYLTAFKFFSCFCQLAARGSFLDMAPRYCSFLSGIGYIIASLGGVLTTILVGYVVKNHIRSEWNICFITIGILHTMASIYFYKYGSGEVQDWAKVKVDGDIEGISTFVKKEPLDK